MLIRLFALFIVLEKVVILVIFLNLGAKSVSAHVIECLFLPDFMCKFSGKCIIVVDESAESIAIHPFD